MNNAVVLKPGLPVIETENIRQILFQIDIWIANNEYDLARKTWKLLAEQAEVYSKKMFNVSLEIDTTKVHPAT